MNIDKAKSSLDKVLRVVSILSIVAILFAVWFSIQFAKSKTKKERKCKKIKVIQKSKLCIGIGSGLSWLSWSTGTPTCIIYGFSYTYT